VLPEAPPGTTHMVTSLPALSKASYLLNQLLCRLLLWVFCSELTARVPSLSHTCSSMSTVERPTRCIQRMLLQAATAHT
jgi:hypothetical protein